MYKDFICNEVMAKLTNKDNEDSTIYLNIFNGLKMYEQLFFICYIGIENNDLIASRNYIISFKYTSDNIVSVIDKLILVQWFV